jgi:hypothetical protein
LLLTESISNHFLRSFAKINQAHFYLVT